MAASVAPTANSKDVGWYIPGLPQLPENIKVVLESWSGIDPTNDGIEKYVEVIPGRCTHIHAVGGYRFLHLGLAEHPAYPAVVKLMKSTPPPATDDTTAAGSAPPILVDLGCCVGQDLRRCVYDGIPGSQLVGIELEPTFVEIGYKLFRDREKLGTRFVFVDILGPEAESSEALAGLVGRVSVLWASAFVHLWDLAGQITLCRKIVSLLRAEPASRVLGRHVGSETPKEIQHSSIRGGRMYQHNPESFWKLWAEVLGHDGEANENGLIRSPEHGLWRVKAWLEEDRYVITSRAHDNEWLAKVMEEGAQNGRADSQKVTPGSGPGRHLILVWEVERLE